MHFGADSLRETVRFVSRMTLRVFELISGKVVVKTERAIMRMKAEKNLMTALVERLVSFVRITVVSGKKIRG